MPGSIEVALATSNRHKFLEATFVLGPLGFELKRLPSKGTEIQSDDVSEVAGHAAGVAYSHYGIPLLVEDTGLFVPSLGGFPGTYGAQAFRTIGNRGLLRLLRAGDSRRAEFVSAVAYADGQSSPKVFAGRLEGKIARTARGNLGFGFDPIFIPVGRRRTLAEMTLSEKCSISHRAIALRAFSSWLRQRKSG